MQIKQIEKNIKLAINDYCKTLDDGFRNHLGASEIGGKCERKIFMGFRWTYRDEFKTKTIDGEIDEKGRFQRLFKRGHAEEDRMISYLRGVGIEVIDRDYSKPPDENGEYPQIRVSDIDGHFGGSTDGIVAIPSALTGLPDKLWAILEMKTYSKQSFSKLLNVGVGGLTTYGPFKLEHVVQFNIYGEKLSNNDVTFEYALYVAINKDDDNIHIQLVPLDRVISNRYTNRALKIITSTKPPEREFKRTDIECKYCGANSICYGEKPSMKNCRSCKYATPAPDASWLCNLHGDIIPTDFIKVGCDKWSDIMKE